MLLVVRLAIRQLLVRIELFLFQVHDHSGMRETEQLMLRLLGQLVVLLVYQRRAKLMLKVNTFPFHLVRYEAKMGREGKNNNK